jgi:hypothetical protein
LYGGKKYLKNLRYFRNLKKLCKVGNRPIGENSPNLVTLEEKASLLVPPASSISDASKTGFDKEIVCR